MQFYSITDRGKKRINNEDSCVAKKIGEFTVLILADGMGGHSGGEIASSRAIDSCLDVLSENLSENLFPAQIFNVLSLCLDKANKEICTLSEKDSALSGMGTTLDICLVLQNTAYIAHIGDGRIYKASGGKLRKLTKDHSLMEYMIEQGQITPEEAEYHPQRNVITRALGSHPRAQEDTLKIDINKGDVLLLCSDGLTNMLTEEKISEILSSRSDIKKAAKELIMRANDEGGYDNITVILAQY